MLMPSRAQYRGIVRPLAPKLSTTARHASADRRRPLPLRRRILDPSPLNWKYSRARKTGTEERRVLAGYTGTTNDWEIAADYGRDIPTTRAGSPKLVVKDQWYTQALRVTRNANGSKTLVFYNGLPSLANADVIEATVPAAYGEINPT